MGEGAVCGARVGGPAPALRLPSLDGPVVDLADARGQPFLVSFLRHAG